MPTDSRQKRPSEIIQLGADFSARMLTGESLVGGNVSITVENALTDADDTSTILVSGSTSVSGDVVLGVFQAGTDGTTYVITFATGATSAGNSYTKKIVLEITNTPKSDSLLANRDELKRELNITDTTDDQFLDELLLASSDYIRSRCARDFELKTYSEIHYIRRPEDTSFLTLREWPVQTVSQIEWVLYDGTAQVTITDQSLYKWGWKEEGELFFLDGHVFYRYPNYNRITYRAGYSVVPHDIRKCCKELASWMYYNSQTGGLLKERIGDYSYTKRSLEDLPPQMRMELPVEYVESVIKRYRRMDIFEAE